MDFVTTAAIELSEPRASALRNVQQLVPQRLDVPRRSEEDAADARARLDTVARLREAAGDAGRVAEQAVGQASTMTGEVEALSQASAAVGEVIRIISGIADRTNLLALDATSAIIGELDSVQAPIGDVLEEQARMATAVEARG